MMNGNDISFTSRYLGDSFFTLSITVNESRVILRDTLDVFYQKCTTDEAYFQINCFVPWFLGGI